jgi:hypothetical protein
LSDLKIPEPTKTPSAPSCMQSAASAGVAIPPAVKVTTGAGRSPPPSARARRSLEVLRLAVQLVGIHRAESLDRSEHGAHVRHRVDDVAGPRFTLRPDHRGALGDAASASPIFVQPQTNGTVNFHLSM